MSEFLKQGTIIIEDLLNTLRAVGWDVNVLNKWIKPEQAKCCAITFSPNVLFFTCGEILNMGNIKKWYPSLESGVVLSILLPQHALSNPFYSAAYVYIVKEKNSLRFHFTN